MRQNRIRMTGMLALLGLAAMTFHTVNSAPLKKENKGVLSYTVKNIDGKNVPLSRYRGQVLLIVNTASKCGNTPQYASLEKLYKSHKSQGLRILAFPANNFGAQEPGSDKEIKFFCSQNYNTSFDLFSKVSVKGEDKTPLYQYLTDKKTNPKYGGEVEWNFAKFLIGRDGQVVGRFPAGKDPLSPDVMAAIQEELKKPAPRKK